MFCTGAAPDRARDQRKVSRGRQPCPRSTSTKSCQFSPAPASTISRRRAPRPAAAHHLDLDADLRHVLREHDVAAAAEDELGARPSWRVVDDAAHVGVARDAHPATAPPPQAEGVVGFQADTRFDMHERIFADTPCPFTYHETLHNAQLRYGPGTNLVEVKNAVDQTARKSAHRFDFKGSSAKVELKDKELTIWADSDFQIGR
jgi:hypothetical protein